MVLVTSFIKFNIIVLGQLVLLVMSSTIAIEPIFCYCYQVFSVQYHQLLSSAISPDLCYWLIAVDFNSSIFIRPDMIHRDVKSANILLSEKLDAKIEDFGLSKGLPDDQTTHILTDVIGTTAYLDPELHDCIYWK